MQVEYINPFVESVHELFSTMLGAQSERGEVRVAKTDKLERSDITALIGIGGPGRGTVALGFPKETAIAILERMLGIQVDTIDETVVDGMAEVVNMIAGNAKAKLRKGDEEPLVLTLPNVILGQDHTVEYPSGVTWVVVPFTSDLGPLTLRVTFELDK